MRPKRTTRRRGDTNHSACSILRKRREVAEDDSPTSRRGQRTLPGELVPLKATVVPEQLAAEPDAYAPAYVPASALRAELPFPSFGSAVPASAPGTSRCECESVRP